MTISFKEFEKVLANSIHFTSELCVCGNRTWIEYGESAICSFCKRVRLDGKSIPRLHT